MRSFFSWSTFGWRASRQQKKVSKFMRLTNENYKIFLNHLSWIVYLIAGIMIVVCFYYYFVAFKKRWDHRRRRQEAQRSHQRTPQRRRPGVACRDHEIFRNVLLLVHKYMANKDKVPTKPYVLRRTRSGVLYGRFADANYISG